VYKIKLTMIEINKNNMWKIGYYDNNRIKKSVRILPRFLNKHFDEFTIQVKIANKNVNIQNWSHSLDLDQ
jgi:ribosomal protein L31E